MNITTKTRTSIRESLFAKNGHEITHGAKEKSLNSIKEIIQNKVQSCRTPDEKNAVINSVKLAVKTPLFDKFITSLEEVEKVKVLDPTLDVNVVPFGITILLTDDVGVIAKVISADAEVNDPGV